MDSSTRTFFAFQDIQTGLLARLADDSDENWLTRAGDDHFYLSKDPSFPVYEASSAEELANVLAENTAGCNSRPSLPGWGEFRLEELRPVKATVTTQLEDVALPHSNLLKTRWVHGTTKSVAHAQAGRPFELLEGSDSLVNWVVQLPLGATLESAQAYVGQFVGTGEPGHKRYVYAVLPLPDAYGSLADNGPNCVLAIASGLIR